MSASHSLVLFSGGQDSTACLAWALSNFAAVETVGFDYGQRHAAELTARKTIIERIAANFPEWRRKIGADHVLHLGVLAEIGGSALTENVAIEMRADGLPNTFVPGRNLLFLTVAAALASRRGIHDLVGGMCETDYSGYPDCRAETIGAMQRALNLGMAEEFTIHTPLMSLDKAATWRLAEELGGEKLVTLTIEETVTCYHGAGTRHAWGRGCGSCPACGLRAAGYARYVEEKSSRIR
ncbi:MAG TPA: 7-cyano-7-deazaguanine synthase QueC [Micropepsaceae bacterium]|nr:7-cyano-7-deazaguanine synthase QueC [Micropepsaceae bacterium]